MTHPASSPCPGALCPLSGPLGRAHSSVRPPNRLRCSPDPQDLRRRLCLHWVIKGNEAVRAAPWGRAGPSRGEGQPWRTQGGHGHPQLGTEASGGSCSAATLTRTPAASSWARDVPVEAACLSEHCVRLTDEAAQTLAGLGPWGPAASPSPSHSLSEHPPPREGGRRGGPRGPGCLGAPRGMCVGSAGSAWVCAGSARGTAGPGRESLALQGSRPHSTVGTTSARPDEVQEGGQSGSWAGRGDRGSCCSRLSAVRPGQAG